MSRAASDIATERALDPPAAAVSDEVRVLVPTKRRIRLSDLWTTRKVAWVVGVRDMKIKYKQSALGPIWLFMQPMGMLLAVAIAFSAVVKVNTGGVSYAPFALAGLCVWTFVQVSAASAALIFPSNYQLVRRSPCPRVALVIGNVLSNLVPLGVVLAAALIVTAIDRSLPLQVLLLPALLAWMIVFVLALSLLAASVGARFRDVVAMVPLLVQAGVFISPVGYPVGVVHGIAGTLIRVNPISGLIETSRWCLLGIHPLTGVILIAAGWTVVLVGLAWFVFARLEVQFADYV